jgi:FixJ family two-component response regulator
VVDDDAPMREALQNLLRSVGLRVEAFASAQEFLRSTRPDVPSCLVLDVRLPGLSGLELQQRLAEGDMAMPIIFITGHGDIPMTVQAMAGAVEFCPSPSATVRLGSPSRRCTHRAAREQRQSGNCAAQVAHDTRSGTLAP